MPSRARRRERLDERLDAIVLVMLLVQARPVRLGPRLAPIELRRRVCRRRLRADLVILIVLEEEARAVGLGKRLVPGVARRGVGTGDESDRRLRILRERLASAVGLAERLEPPDARGDERRRELRLGLSLVLEIAPRHVATSSRGSCAPSPA